MFVYTGNSIILCFSYYFAGPGAKLQQYINSSYYTQYEQHIRVAKDTVAFSENPHLPIWLGEGADSWAGGTPNISDTFVSGFL